MSETLPLYTLCKEDLESMDKEVSPSAAGPVPLAALSSLWPAPPRPVAPAGLSVLMAPACLALALSFLLKETDSSTKRCIRVSPHLALRQLCDPQRGPPRLSHSLPDPTGA